MKSNANFHRAMLWFIDWVLLNLSLFVVMIFFPKNNSTQEESFIFFYWYNLSWIIAVYLNGLYQTANWFKLSKYFSSSIRTVLMYYCFNGLIYFVQPNLFSSFFLFWCVAIFTGLSLLHRLFFQLLLLWAGSHWHKRVVIIGNNEAAQKMAHYVKATPQWYNLVAMFSNVVPEGANHSNAMQRNEHKKEVVFSELYNSENLGEKNNFSGIDTMVNGFFPSLNTEKETVAIPLGKMNNTQLVNTEDEISINECIEYLNKHQVTDLYCALSPETFPYLYQLAKQSEDRFVHFKFVADVNQMVKDGKWVESFNDLPLLSLRTQPLTLVSNAMQKRLFDMVFSTFIIIGLLSWLTPIIGIIIALESKGPIFFRQLRSGKNNKPFWCIKFRTLRMNKESDQIQVTKNDHRVTKFGRFLRKSNIDELPQFFNVLMGSMSVVGPRPHMLQHTTAFNALENDYMVRHFVQPGITGLAQINGFRGEIKHPDMLQKRLEKDIHYLENWSMADDLKIIWQTIVVSLKGDKNAY